MPVIKHLTNCACRDRKTRPQDLIDAPDYAKISLQHSELVDWAVSLGTTIHDHVRIYIDPTTGLSLGARPAIEPHQELVACSYSTSLSYLNAIDAAPAFARNTSEELTFPPEFFGAFAEKPHVIGFFFLMQQYLLKDRSHWWPYIRLLPPPPNQPKPRPIRPKSLKNLTSAQKALLTAPHPRQPDVDTSGIMTLWSDDEVRLLEGTNAWATINEKKEMRTKEWMKANTVLRHCWLARKAEEAKEEDDTTIGADEDDDNIKRTKEDDDKKQKPWHFDLYSHELYHWAASIYGSRSFRASLTIPEKLLETSENAQLITSQIREDDFSVLFPVLDLGNHNGDNVVSWVMDSVKTTFSLRNTTRLDEGMQIFNYYGPKSNTELLVAYGFTINDATLDFVEFKLTPDYSSASLRRSQGSHFLSDPKKPQEEFRYRVGHRYDRTDGSIPELSHFSPGLVDTLICMFANPREEQFLKSNPEFSFERLPIEQVTSTPFCHTFFCVLQLILGKLKLDIDKIEEVHKWLEVSKELEAAKQLKASEENKRYLAKGWIVPPDPETWEDSWRCKPYNLALQYRYQQLNVLHAALDSTNLLLSQNYLCSNTFCTHSPTPRTDLATVLSLQCAYGWLSKYYPTIATPVFEVIADDQEEKLPLNWNALIEGDWSQAYWTVWLYIVFLLWARSGPKFHSRHAFLQTWMEEMNATYNRRLLSNPEPAFRANPADTETITKVVACIHKLPFFQSLVNKWLIPNEMDTGLMLFAGLIAEEENTEMKWMMNHGREGDATEEIKQTLMIIGGGGSIKVAEDGPWTNAWRSAPGFRT